MMIFIGNVLINVGPTKEGIIVPEFKRLLLQLGAWLEVNGEAIYDTSPWYHQNDAHNPHVWYTCKKQQYDPLRTSNVPKANDLIIAVYAIFLKWPADDLLKIKDLRPYFHDCVVYLLTSGNHTAVLLHVSYIIYMFVPKRPCVLVLMLILHFIYT